MPSKVRFAGDRNVVIGRFEIGGCEIALLADALGDPDMVRSSLATVLRMAKVVAPCPLPRLHEGVRVVRCHMDFQDLAAKAFDGVQFPGVRCAEIVCEGLLARPVAD